MKTTRPRLWLLLLFISALRAAQEKCKRRDTIDIVPGTNSMQKAPAFFDYNLCKDGLQWFCYLPRECVDNGAPNEFRVATATDMEDLKKCHAVLAIQYHTEHRWRVVMQGINVAKNATLAFIVNCLPEFACWKGSTGLAAGMQRKNGQRLHMQYDEWYGLSEGDKLMCDFMIDGGEQSSRFPMAREPSNVYSGMLAPTVSGALLASFEFSSTMYYTVTAEKKGTADANQRCFIQIKFGPSPAPANETIVPVNVDEELFRCPADYQMRWANIGIKEFKDTRYIRCKKGQSGVYIETDGREETRSSAFVAHCAQKNCKQCQAPACSNAAKCPRLTNISGADFDICVELECPDKDHTLVHKVGGRPVPVDVPVCDGSGWVVGNTRLQDVECAPANCPNAMETIKMNDVEKFNITEHEVTCNAETDEIRYKDENDVEVRLKSVFCNLGEWVEEQDSGSKPYADSELECGAPPPKAAAQGGFVLYAGIAAGVLAIIVGALFVIICCLLRRKKKTGVSAIKHKLATKSSKSRDSKTVSKGTTSKCSGGPSSDRSVTGARGKKKGGDKEEVPVIPDDPTKSDPKSGPKQPEPRSKPTGGSSIAKTSKLQKLQAENEKKKAAAAAALLETSKVEDNQEEQPPTDTPIDTAVIPKDSIDGTQPEQPPTPVAPKPRVLKRPKKAVIIDSNEQFRPIDSPLPLDRILTPKPALAPETPQSVMAKTQAGGAEGEPEPEQPLWNNQPPPAAVDATQEPAAAPAATPTADSQTQDELKTSREKERDAAAESAARKKKIADMPTGKKKESAKKVKSNKTTTPKPESKEQKNGRPSLLRPSDLVSDKSSSKKGGGGEKGSAKKKEKRRVDEPSKKIDATQHQHVHGSELGCGPLCQPIPKSQTDSEEN